MAKVMHSSKVYTRLQESLGLADHGAVLNTMLSKIAKNLQVYGSSEELVHLTLMLFQVRPRSWVASQAGTQRAPSASTTVSAHNACAVRLAHSSPTMHVVRAFIDARTLPTAT